MLDWDVFTRVVDEAGPSLVRIDFFNYGEAFLHKRAVEMCEYIKTKFPHIYLYTSTNGLALNEEKARRLVHSGIDEVTFSIDGASQETYARYRQRGKFDVAHREPARDGRREGEERPRRPAAQLALHPVQVERQRRGDGARARSSPQRSASIACAGRSPIIPRTRSRAASCRARRISSASATRSGTTTISATRFPARRRARRSTCVTGFPALPLRGRAARAAGDVRRACSNLSTRPFRAQASYGRRLVRLGAQLLDERGAMLNRDHARAWLPGDIPPGGSADVQHRHPRAGHAGPLHAEVRPRQRRHRLVRSLRIGDDDSRDARSCGESLECTELAGTRRID